MIKPARKYLLVVPHKAEKKEKGLIIPTEKGAKMWKIVEQGTSVIDFANGDIVILHPYHNGTTVEEEGIEYTIVEEDRVLAVVK